MRASRKRSYSKLKKEKKQTGLIENRRQSTLLSDGDVSARVGASVDPPTHALSQRKRCNVSGEVSSRNRSEQSPRRRFSFSQAATLRRRLARFAGTDIRTNDGERALRTLHMFTVSRGNHTENPL